MSMLPKSMYFAMSITSCVHMLQFGRRAVTHSRGSLPRSRAVASSVVAEVYRGY